jgi:hypothetical protein
MFRERETRENLLDYCRVALVWCPTNVKRCAPRQSPLSGTQEQMRDKLARDGFDPLRDGGPALILANGRVDNAAAVQAFPRVKDQEVI